MDVAVTGLDGQSRPTEDHPNRQLQARYDQKMAKYGYIAEQNRFQLIPAIFSSSETRIEISACNFTNQTFLVNPNSSRQARYSL